MEAYKCDLDVCRFINFYILLCLNTFFEKINLNRTVWIIYIIVISQTEI